MNTKAALIVSFAIAPVAVLGTLTGCEKQEAATSTANDHGHDHGPGGEHTSESSSGHAPGHGGAVIQLGEKVIGSFNTKATRDEGAIVAGKDAPIDVTVTPTAGSTAKAVAVRFWIGTQDAKGSVKARAEIEDPNDPNRWHTHAEIPNPIPSGAALWVEIEDDKGGTSAGSFEMRQ